ncbi:ribosomal protein S5 domain 2-like protein [Myriangium duriaei CBS 260.36]|uniref:Ribosomal RNA-processing protein 43 n=1 Tax=Myriangium duriaei CBS 260.36 TaxID=1168546 RepID=A0A9P4ME24_9PEZI|nr:ribosomal protein S5 domain 2-like protein [Myriangium duriaei CBS 260.36]
MASTAPATLSPLSFPPATFAKLTPGPYLLAHLQPSDSKTPSTRPSGRAPLETRKPTIQTGSLSHSNGSAVVRIGATSIVVGIRAEILRAQDIPHQRHALSSSPTSDDEISRLGLLIPNLELSTGSSPSNLPGNPPSTLAQSLTHRLSSLLHSTHLLSPSDLHITGPSQDDPSVQETKAYWALYIDGLLLSHDGAVFDAAWAAVVAALADTRLPAARWDADYERVVCSPLAEEARKLEIRGRPMAVSFAAFESGSRIRGEKGKGWILADPDGFEEGVCRESVTVTVDGGMVVRVEKSGGAVVGVEEMRDLIGEAERRWGEWREAMG